MFVLFLPVIVESDESSASFFLGHYNFMLSLNLCFQQVEGGDRGKGFV